MTVKEIDRRFLIVHEAGKNGLITCVWSRIGQTARLSSPMNERTKVFTTSTQ